MTSEPTVSEDLETVLNELNAISIGDGEASNWSFTNALPLDIWYAIMAFMSLDSIKTLSLCSNKYRDLVAPIIFSHITLNKNSRAAFEYGSLTRMRPLVRYVTLSIQEVTKSPGGKIIHPQSSRGMKATYSLARKCADAIILFGGLRGIKLQFQEQALTLFKSIVSSEIIRRISRCPTHRNIQSITIDHFEKYIDSKSHKAGLGAFDAREVDYIYRTEEKLNSRQYHLPGIKTLDLKFFGALDFSDSIPDSVPKVHLNLLHSSAPTLRKLSIMAGSIYIGSDKDGRWPGYLKNISITYPVLENLTIIIHKWTSSQTLDVITTVFPNVQYLTLDSAGYAQIWGQESEGQPVYPHLKKLKRLKRVRILRSPPSHDRAWNMLDRPKMQEKQRMAESIRAWVRGGLDDLEYVQFVRRKARDSPLEAFARTLRDDEDRLAFLITRKDGEVKLDCRMQFPDWYRPGHRDIFYIDLKDVLFEDKLICQYKERLVGEI
ncbi:hypothetical protein TWF281_010951 [Arthrobotrys megalospora]